VTLLLGLILVVTAFSRAISSSIAAFNSRAALGEKLKDTEPSTKFRISGVEDIRYFCLISGQSIILPEKILIKHLSKI
jgi:hypothetical protein